VICSMVDAMQCAALHCAVSGATYMLNSNVTAMQWRQQQQQQQQGLAPGGVRTRSGLSLSWPMLLLPMCATDTEGVNPDADAAAAIPGGCRSKDEPSA
jgi:hypothetical protein